MSTNPVKISALPAGTVASGPETLAVVQGGDTVKMTVDQLLNFDPTFNYVAQTIGWSHLQGAINIGWFIGADKTGATDMSSIMAAAALLGHAIYLPAGTWAMNWTILKPVVVFGEGARNTIVKPYNIALAAMTYALTSTGPYWSYSTLIQSLRFTTSGANQTGVGFTFGATTQGAYTAGMEYQNGVTFRNCQFLSLNKGVQFPFGNIGSQFDVCDFQGNYYGAYCLDNKNYPGVAGSNAMHAGNKYFNGGRFDGNVCGIYVHNATQGYYGIETRGTLFEDNNIDIYHYTTNTTNAPVEISGGGSEGSGALVSASTVAIDAWTGSTVSTYSAPPHRYIFDGVGSQYNLNGGDFGDCYLKATSSRVINKGSHVESAPGFGSYPCVVDDANSAIYIHDPETNGGVGTSPRVFVRGNFRPTSASINSGQSLSRAFYGSHCYNKVAGSYGPGATVVNLTAGSNLGNGSFNVTAGTASDGVIYGTCNTWSLPFTAGNQQVALIAGIVSVAAGVWAVMTMDIKVTSGTNFTLNAWDRSSNQLFAGIAVPELNVWYTIKAMGYFPNAIAAFYGLDFSSTGAGTVAAEGSAFQFKTFATEHEAQAFLESGVYIGP